MDSLQGSTYDFSWSSMPDGALQWKTCAWEKDVTHIMMRNSKLHPSSHAPVFSNRSHNPLPRRVHVKHEGLFDSKDLNRNFGGLKSLKKFSMVAV